jgi:hypothetical protein
VQSQPTAAPAVQPQPTAAPVAAAPTAAPAVQSQPTAAPAATSAPQPVVAAPPIACDPIAGLPVFAGATCIDRDSDVDDGVTKFKNTYTATANAEEIRRFYEGAFGQNGWTLGDFSYDLNLGQRRAGIDVDTDQGPAGVVTKVRLTEYGVAATAGTTCAPIAALPAFPNAACIEFDLDQDDGVLKAESTYSTTASPEEVRRFYEGTLAQNGWAGPDFQYDLQQGLRRLQVDVETQQSPQGTLTQFSISEE